MFTVHFHLYGNTAWSNTTRAVCSTSAQYIDYRRIHRWRSIVRTLLPHYDNEQLAAALRRPCFRLQFNYNPPLSINHIQHLYRRARPRAPAAKRDQISKNINLNLQSYTLFGRSSLRPARARVVYTANLVSLAIRATVATY